MSVIGVFCINAMILATTGNTPVADAAMKHDKDTVRSLLRQGADVNSAQGDGMTALHWAATNGDAEMTESLIYAGANVRAQTRLGAYTPLFFAAQSGSPGVVEKLLKAGAGPNETSTNGVTPLMMAATAGNPEVVKLLIEHGAKVNARESAHGQTPLMFAAAFNRVEAIRILTRNGADPSIATEVRMPDEKKLESSIPASATAAAGDRSQQAALNADDPPPPPPDPMGGLTPLHYAARENHVEAVRALLDAGTDINPRSADGHTPLTMAVVNSRFDLAMYLLKRGADPNIASVQGVTPLFAAVNAQWAPLAFYPQSTNPRQEKTTHLQLMQALLDRGANPDVRVTKNLWYGVWASIREDSLNTAGRTAFWRAAQASDIDAMRLLVAAGADPQIPDEAGVTPLSVAAGNGWRGTNVNSPVGWLPAVRYLVEELGAEVNTADKDGYTPLHGAAERGDNQVILYLVSKGADVTVRSKPKQSQYGSEPGRTVADMANSPRQRIQPFPETIDLLVRLGATNSNKCLSC